MKKVRTLTGLMVLGAMVFMFSCKKDPGPGGNAHIHGHVEHEATGEVIVNAAVSIWYGATTKPSTGADDATSTDAHGEFEFENLNKGDYFLYAVGQDSTGTTREGGVHVEVDSKSGEFDADIHVD